MTLAAASILLTFLGSFDRAFPRKSKAFKFSPMRRYSNPIVVSTSALSGQSCKASRQTWIAAG